MQNRRLVFLYLLLQASSTMNFLPFSHGASLSLVSFRRKTTQGCYFLHSSSSSSFSGAVKTAEDATENYSVTVEPANDTTCSHHGMFLALVDDWHSRAHVIKAEAGFIHYDIWRRKWAITKCWNLLFDLKRFGNPLINLCICCLICRSGAFDQQMVWRNQSCICLGLADSRHNYLLKRRRGNIRPNWYCILVHERVYVQNRLFTDWKKKKQSHDPHWTKS